MVQDQRKAALVSIVTRIAAGEQINNADQAILAAELELVIVDREAMAEYKIFRASLPQVEFMEFSESELSSAWQGGLKALDDRIVHLALDVEALDALRTGIWHYPGPYWEERI